MIASVPAVDRLSYCGGGEDDLECCLVVRALVFFIAYDNIFPATGIDDIDDTFGSLGLRSQGMLSMLVVYEYEYKLSR